MATLVLAAAGTALGNAVGGTALGLSLAAVGRAAGAVAGAAIDARVMGAGSALVETGRVDRFRLTGASEGAPVSQIYGQMRVAGQVIWATRFREQTEEIMTGGGGGGPFGPPQPVTTTLRYSYAISLAIALCEGRIGSVGRIWADGVEISPQDLVMRVHDGSADQPADPLIAAIQGEDVPAFRGMAYVVIEDLGLARWGNRVPQFSFEVFRPAQEPDEDLSGTLRAVALMPGSGEYVLAREPVYVSEGFGRTVAVNMSTPSGKSDLETSLDQLAGELPQVGSVLLVVSWFGDDLRAGQCRLRPKVDQAERDAIGMPWAVAGLNRLTAEIVPQDGTGRAVYGGTPADAAVIQAIQALKERGQAVVFYPFILMEQLEGNGLPDPWSDAGDQPVLPWRGRITTAKAPGQAGSSDGTSAAEAEVQAFFGQAQPGDFSVSDGAVIYAGPDEWRFRRFILHYAHLCVAAGGVDTFCIGSEMRSLTQIRGQNGFPAVAALRVLAQEVRAVLGPECKITYAADWSEYHGYQPVGTSDKMFHLDPLWADPAIDVIGIDNYMPLSDWRDDADHADAEAGSIYDLDYLTGNVAGGELYDWFYTSTEARAAQARSPITDGMGEPWIYRPKDILNWWRNAHHDRIGGERALVPTAWQPQSKPVWFTELGCPAVDKGTNEPNKFVDPKSSESALPHFSDGSRDDLIQLQYLRAMHRHFADEAANPVSEVYGAPMVDMGRAHVWAWDARPFPQFPRDLGRWADGINHALGHWLNGRATARSLASVVQEICARAGVNEVDVTRLHGLVRGYAPDDQRSARAALQPLMLAYGFDAAERDGKIVFTSRDAARPVARLKEAQMVEQGPQVPVLEQSRAAEAEVSGRLRVGFVTAGEDYAIRTVEAVMGDAAGYATAQSELALALLPQEAQDMADGWLATARVGRDTLRFALPPSLAGIGAGDVVELQGAPGGLYRIDRVEAAEFQQIEAVRVEARGRASVAVVAEAMAPFDAPVPVEAIFMDLPIVQGPPAPWLALTASPWPGAVAVQVSGPDGAALPPLLIRQPAVIGETLNVLDTAAPGRWDRGAALRVRLVSGALSSATEAQLLAGRNVAIVGDGSLDKWEVFQFAEAVPVAPLIWDLSLRLRGQAGSDGIMPASWPAGSFFVLLDGTPMPLGLPEGAQGQVWDIRYGPAARGFDDPSHRSRTLQFQGNASRPYAVCHLRAEERPDGALRVNWVRRTREGGDSWMGAEVPLGEVAELYAVQVRQGDVVLREVTVSAPVWDYPADHLAIDGPGLVLAVAQVSESYGPGPWHLLELG